MSNLIEIRWHGRGGQGAKTASLLLADAAFNTGKYIQGFPEYGPERMGAPITAYNRISDTPITVHSNIYEPDYVVVVDDTLLECVDVTAGLKSTGAIIINTTKDNDELKKLLKGYSGDIYKIDARKVSMETLGKYFPNTPMLAAVVKVSGIMSDEAFLEDMVGSFKHKFAKKPEVIDGNMKALEMALHDRDEDILRTMACGIAGLSVAADSLSAIKYAKVKVIRDETGLAVDYEIEGDYPKFGNDDEKVDSIAVDIVKTFMNKLKRYNTYRNAKTTMSILTITSNVVYGKATGNTPDGRRAGEPFGPGANPLHGRDTNGALAVMNSIAKLPYEYSEDGISYTFSITPGTLGQDEETKINRFDIVALHKDEYNDWIKRVVGLPHETLSYQEGILYINGQRIDEPFIHPSYFFNFNVEEIVLGENEYYVIGDNRHDTTKSIIQRSQIYGINGFIFKTCTQPNKNGMGIFESGCKITYKKL